MHAPLHGKEILITREKNKSKAFADLITTHGGKPVEIPLLKISCNSFNEKINISDYQWIFFTSANGVTCFFEKVQELTDTIRIAVVGHKTELALQQFGKQANFIPTRYNADVMASEFLQREKIEGPILIIKGNKSRGVLQQEFQMNNIYYDEMETYTTSISTESKSLLNTYFKDSKPDYLTFTSPSTVEAFVDMMESEVELNNAKEIPCVCIGSTTEERAAQLGFCQTLIPNEYTVEGLVDKMADYIRKKG